MTFKWLLATLAALLCLTACERQHLSAQESIERLELMKLGIRADLVRGRAECQAVALESNGNPKDIELCQRGLRLDIDVAQRRMDDIDKQIAVLRSPGP